MAGGAEGDLLIGQARVGFASIVGRYQPRHVHKQLAGRRLAGKRVGGHRILTSHKEGSWATIIHQ